MTARDSRNSESATILLVQPSTNSRAALAATLATSEHLGLAYLSAALRLSGRLCRILDLETKPITPQELAIQVKAEKVKLVGFSPTSLSAPNAIEHLHAIKERCRDTIVIWGGHLATGLGMDTFSAVPSLDAVVTGDGIPVIALLTEAVEMYGRLPEHPQVLVNPTGMPTLVTEFKRRKVPSWVDLVPIRSLTRADYERSGARILTSLGCPFKCAFCTTPFMFEGRKTLRTIPHIAAEIQLLRSEFGVKRLWINDDLFIDGSTASHKRAIAFAHEVRSIDSELRFRPLCRPDSFRRDWGTLDTLATCGMDTVFIGFESGDDDTLIELNKRVNTQVSRQLVDELDKRNIRLQIGFIMFTARATINSLRRNVDFLYDIGELYRMFPVTRTVRLFPGTELWYSLHQTESIDENRSTPFLKYPRFSHPEILEMSVAFEQLEEDFAEIDAIMYERRVSGKLSMDIHRNVSLKIREVVMEAMRYAENGYGATTIRSHVKNLLPELETLVGLQSRHTYPIGDTVA